MAETLEQKLKRFVEDPEIPREIRALVQERLSAPDEPSDKEKEK